MKIKFCPFCGSHAASDICYACGADLAAVSAACPDIKVSDDMSTVLEFGRYPYTADGAEAAIRWIVLEKTGNAALLLAENVIDCRRFKDGASGARWSECALREWLNGEFLITAFMEDERDSIVLKVHTDGGNEHCGINGGEEVADSVFLLSIAEMEKYFGVPFTSRATATEYAAEQGVWRMDNGCVCWWLRSPGEEDGSVANVNENGLVNASGDSSQNSIIGVRPALWVLAEAVGLDEE